MKLTNHVPMLLVKIIFLVEIIATTSSTASGPGEVLWKFDVSHISGAFVTVGSDGTIYTWSTTNGASRMRVDGENPELRAAR